MFSFLILHPLSLYFHFYLRTGRSFWEKTLNSWSKKHNPFFCFSFLRVALSCPGPWGRPSSICKRISWDCRGVDQFQKKCLLCVAVSANHFLYSHAFFETIGILAASSKIFCTTTLIACYEMCQKRTQKVQSYFMFFVSCFSCNSRS